MWQSRGKKVQIKISENSGKKKNKECGNQKSNNHNE